jgi:hypothetical protein
MRGMILGSMGCGVWAAFRLGGVGRRWPVYCVWAAFRLGGVGAGGRYIAGLGVSGRRWVDPCAG